MDRELREGEREINLAIGRVVGRWRTNNRRVVVLDTVRKDRGESGGGLRLWGTHGGERERERREYFSLRERRDLRMGEDHSGIDLSLLIFDGHFRQTIPSI